VFLFLGTVLQCRKQRNKLLRSDLLLYVAWEQNHITLTSRQTLPRGLSMCCMRDLLAKAYSRPGVRHAIITERSVEGTCRCLRKTRVTAAKRPDAPSLVRLADVRATALDFLRQRLDCASSTSTPALLHHAIADTSTFGTLYLATERLYRNIHGNSITTQHSTPHSLPRGTHTQWATVIALAAAAAAAMVAVVTRLKSTSVTTAHSNTIPTLHHNVTTTLVHRLARPHIARLARLHPSMASLETRTEIGVASLSEALLADRATDPSRTSHSTHLDREHQMALRLTVHKARARGPEGSTETTVALVTQAEVQAHRVVAAAASDPSQHTTALF
jgi:hypothetical protein